MPTNQGCCKITLVSMWGLDLNMCTWLESGLESYFIFKLNTNV